MLLPYFSIICNAWHAAAQGIIPHQLKDLGCSIQHPMSLYKCTAAGEIYNDDGSQQQPAEAAANDINYATTAKARATFAVLMHISRI